MAYAATDPTADPTADATAQVDEILRVDTPLGPEEVATVWEGRGTPSAVAWHGTSLVNRLSGWDVLLPLRPLVMTGLPGHGPVAEKPAAHYAGYTPEHFMDTGEAVLRTVSENTPLLLAGGSLGGTVALGVAYRAPELVSGLVLISPLVWPDIGGLIGMWSRLAKHPTLCEASIFGLLGPARLSPRMLKLSAMGFVADANGYLSNPTVDEVVAAGHAVFRSSPLPGLAATMRVIRDFDLRPQLSAGFPDVPVLILHGTSDPIVPYDQAVWLAKSLPAAVLRPLPRLGHLPHAECEELVAGEVADWLADRGFK